MTIAVLALQGAFIEHEQILQKLGVDTIELRQISDLQKDFDGIILPGGESTVQGKLLRDLGMFEPLKEKIQSGMPVLATCAGMILLASDITEQEETYFGTIPMTVKRNAYGRQLGSFHTKANANGIGKIPMTFIRAPYVETVYTDNTGCTPEILSIVQDRIVGVKYKNQMAFAFHPELDQDTRVHKDFLGMISQTGSRGGANWLPPGSLSAPMNT